MTTTIYVNDRQYPVSTVTLPEGVVRYVEATVDFYDGEEFQTFIAIGKFDGESASPELELWDAMNVFYWCEDEDEFARLASTPDPSHEFRIL